MGRRHKPRLEPPPVVSPPVPDVQKRRHLSRQERRALKERQMSFESIEPFPQYSAEREGD